MKSSHIHSVYRFPPAARSKSALSALHLHLFTQHPFIPL